MKEEKFNNPEQVVVELIRAGLIKLHSHALLSAKSVEEAIEDSARLHALYLRRLRAELSRSGSDDEQL